MNERYVYFVKYGQLNKSTNRFEFWNTDVYSSLKKAKHRIKNSMDVNKAYDVVKWESHLPTTIFKNSEGYEYSHDCTGTDSGRTMRIRIYIERKILN